MPIDPVKKRARWRRNKAAERARRHTEPGALDPAFEKRVRDERDRRARLGNYAEYVIRSSTFWEPGSWVKAVEFAADVWAAGVLIEAQRGVGSATPTSIARWLQAAGKDHGYTEGSLRKMIYKARERIVRLETAESSIRRGQLVWPAFGKPPP